MQVNLRIPFRLKFFFQIIKVTTLESKLNVACMDMDKRGRMFKEDISQ